MLRRVAGSAYLALALGLWVSSVLALPRSGPPSLLDISISELGELLDAGAVSSIDLVRLYSRRIAEVNGKLNAVIELNPDALIDAQVLDAERARGNIVGSLHGIPILVKDNYATTDPTLTGAGSVCLARSRPIQEATVVARLREAGAIILGKANLSEFSGVRGTNVSVGWSPRGGLAYGAYVEHQSPCGSSSGSAVAASLGLAAATLGTETAGSITCPAMFNNVVGIKPTVGLTSRFGVVPITARQDTAGPLSQTVEDAALMLDVIAGRDELDNYTSAQPWDAPPSYLSSLNASALMNKRLGVVWIEDAYPGSDHLNWKQTKSVFDQALSDLAAAGAELVKVELHSKGRSLQEEMNFMMGNTSLYTGPDVVEGMARYMRNLMPGPDVPHNISELYQCLKAEPEELPLEVPLDDWERLVQVNKSAGGQQAWQAYKTVSETSRHLFIDPIEEHDLDALVMHPDLALAISASPGLPIVTVPMGYLGEDAETHWDDQGTYILSAPGFPLGISFTADRWSEQDLINYAYAYEQISRKRKDSKPKIQPQTDLDTILH
ncbi:amidase signature domain-containing protein [Xylariomycetidae sp. FL0641]|nr:amidase signature domain-containing protein [Xylariomycetidae sp. FL0641]